MAMAAGMLEPPAVQNAPGGCEQCDSTGYRGRVGIYEILVFNDSIRHATRSNNQNDEIRVLARNNGMKFMQEHGLELVRDGITTLEELQRVVPFAQLTPESCASCGRPVSAAFSFCPYCGASRFGRERQSHTDCKPEVVHK